MEKQLKKICMKKRLPAIIILFIAAIALLVLWLPDLFLYMKGPAQLSDLTVDELSGAYVEAHIEGIYDWYAQDVETSGSSEKIVAREYLIPVGEYEYMSLYAPEKYLIPSDAAVDFEKLVLTKVGAARLLNGLYDEYPHSAGLYRVYCEEEFWGVGEIGNGGVLKMLAYVRG